MVTTRLDSMINYWKEKHGNAEPDDYTIILIKELVANMDEYDLHWQDNKREKELFRKGVDLRRRLGIYLHDIKDTRNNAI